jgi:hypothetical protein
MPDASSQMPDASSRMPDAGSQLPMKKAGRRKMKCQLKVTAILKYIRSLTALQLRYIK